LLHHQDQPVISYQEALGIILAGSTVLGRRKVPLQAAAGHISAEALQARLDVPAFANAAMDGYAVAASDTASASERDPVILPVAGTVVAGLAPPRATAGGAWEIMTGAPLPAGLDAVVPVERIAEHVRGGPALTAIRLQQPALPGQNVRQMSEDFRRGDRVVEAGTRLAPHHLMGLAACGLDEVSVCEPPRMAILTTGSELAGSGSELQPGQIRDANGPYLQALLARLGITGSTQRSAADSVAALRAELAQLADRCELILTTGGVSAGRLDLVPDVVRALGGEILFHKVAIRPGKPILLARLPGGTAAVWPARQSAGRRGRHALLRHAGAARDAGHAGRSFHTGDLQQCGAQPRPAALLRQGVSQRRQRSAQPGADPARTGVLPDRPAAARPTAGPSFPKVTPTCPPAAPSSPHRCIRRTTPS
jgi:molybdopterin molybdotransferase